MINWVELKNYEKWESFRFECGKITVITGRTGSGKSSIIRGLKKILYNDKGFNIRHGSNSGSIIIEKDNRIIKYVKHTDGSLIWYLDKEQYKHGSVIPEDVKKVLNINDDLNIRVNISEQFNSLFLIKMSGSQLSDVLNSLFKMDISTKVLNKLDAEIRDKKNKIKLYESELQGLKEPDYSYKEKLEKILKQYNKVNNYYALLEKYKRLISIKNKLDKINIDFTDIDLYNKYKRVMDIKNSLENIDKELDDIKDKLKDAEICPITGKPFYKGCLKIIRGEEK